MIVIDGNRVIDFHAHSFRSEILGQNNDLSLMLRAMDMAGIDRACVSDVSCVDGEASNNMNARSSNSGRTASLDSDSPHRSCGKL